MVISYGPKAIMIVRQVFKDQNEKIDIGTASGALWDQMLWIANSNELR